MGSCLMELITEDYPVNVAEKAGKLAVRCSTRIRIYNFIISSTVILAADWSIAVGYWIVFHCLSINGNVRIRINVSYPHSQIEAPTLNVISHSQIEAPTLNVLSHSQIEAPSQCYIPLRHGLSLQVTASFFISQDTQKE